MLAAVLGPSAAAFEQGTEVWATFRLQGPLAEQSGWSMRYRERFSQFFEERVLYQYQIAAYPRLRFMN